MAIEALPQHRGPSKGRVICDDCGATIDVPCGYARQRSDTTTRPNTGQARAKAAAVAGWSYVKRKDRCPICEVKRRTDASTTETTTTETMTMTKTATDAPEQPTKAQRRQIIAMLEECYDDQRGCYQGAETDDTVADVLGVRPAWVAEIREDLFGPAGTNTDMAEVADAVAAANERLRAIEQIVAEARAEMAEARKRIDAIQDRIGAAEDELRKATDDANKALARWDKLAAALSPRIRKKAGV